MIGRYVTPRAATSVASPTWDDPSWIRPRAAYVHVPFCAHKCGYCDFASLAGSDHMAGRYISALEKELIQTLIEPQPVETIFVGGGTPTRLDAALLSQLLTIVRSWFPLAAEGEWTVEANPGTLDAEKIEILAAGGVNRVSLGAQSFQPRLLENSSGTTLRTTSSGRSNCAHRACLAGRWTSSSEYPARPLRIAVVTWK